MGFFPTLDLEKAFSLREFRSLAPNNGFTWFVEETLERVFCEWLFETELSARK